MHLTRRFADLHIRPATMRDYPAICRIAAQADRAHAELLPDVFQAHAGPARTREWVAAYVDPPDADTLLAEVDGVVVGFLSVKAAAHPDYPIFRPHTFALVENLAVDEAWRRRGIGRSLVAEARRWTEMRGLEGIQLTVWVTNTAALAFYERLGFRPLTWRMELRLDKETGSFEDDAEDDGLEPQVGGAA
ncbi:MAG: GNAT family N-acetyltransferase [Armatimonadetes bacterium]|nr:GNAT family N-acetyltransferase [Armatimonadota bacterium]